MKAKRPVSIDGIEFDALIDEERTLEAEVPEYPVDEGFTVSDAIITKAESVTMTLFLTETPVTWRNHSGGIGRVEEVCKRLEELYYRADTVTAVTSSNVYSDMAIENLTIDKSADIGYAKEIKLTLRKVRKTSAQTTTIPESYGKGGATGAPAGEANTGSPTGSGGLQEKLGLSGQDSILKSIIGNTKSRTMNATDNDFWLQ